MHQIQGIRRGLVFVTTLEEQMEEENSVRFIDVFVVSIDLVKLGFKIRIEKTEGRPAFDSKLLLKLYYTVSQTKY